MTDKTARMDECLPSPPPSSSLVPDVESVMPSRRSTGLQDDNVEETSTASPNNNNDEEEAARQSRDNSQDKTAGTNEIYSSLSTKRTSWICACIPPAFSWGRRGFSSSSSTQNDNDNGNSEHDDSDEAPQPKHDKCRLILRILLKFIQYALVLFTIFIVILWIGSEVQEGQAKKAPDTLYLYNTSTVCAIVVRNSTTDQPPFLDIQTFADDTDKLPFAPATTNASSFVAHCGDCGECSNPHDIRIYDETKTTLLEQAIECSQVAFFRGSRGANACMEEHVGLTTPCSHCFVANIMCDIRNCLFVCFWHALFATADNKAGYNGTQALNRCTYCDEKRCGADFVQCAGANRRRSGILSDIERDAELEVCQEVEPQWWLDKDIQAIWDDMQEQRNE